MKQKINKQRLSKTWVLSLIILSALLASSSKAQAYSSDGTIIVRKKHHKSKSLLKRKFVFVHEEAGGGGNISSASSGEASASSALASPSKTDKGGISSFSNKLQKKRAPARANSTNSAPRRSSSGPAKIGYKGTGNSGTAKIGHKRSVNSGSPKIGKRGSNGSEAGDAVGSGTENMISENIHDDANWDSLGEEIEVTESFNVNAKLLR